MKRFFILLIFQICIFTMGCKNNSDDLLKYTVGDEEMNSEIDSDIESNSESEENDELLIVHVSGAVKRAGVYQLKKGKRVVDAIEEAGGLLKDANNDSINMAEKLKDGMKIYVPKEGEKASQEETSSYVDLNLATKQELMTLPGIGEKTAERIIEFREKKEFKKVEDLKKVPGFGEKKMESLKGYICVGGEVYE